MILSADRSVNGSNIAEANTMVKEGALLEAHEAYQSIVEEEPENSAAWYGLGVISNKLGFHDSAIEYLEHSFRLNKNHAPTVANLAILYSGSEPEKANSFAQLALDLGLDDGRLHELASRSDSEGIIVDGQTSDPPGENQAETELVPLLQSTTVTTTPTQSRNEFVESENASETDEMTEADLITQLSKLIRDDEFKSALTILTSVLEGEFKESPSLWHLCGLCLSEMGLHADALGTIQYALTLDENHVPSLHLIGQMLWNSDQKDEAEVFWTKIAEIEPTNPILQSLPQQESQEIMEESTTNSSDSEVSTQHPEQQTEEDSRPLIEGVDEADNTDSIALEDSLVVLIQNARKYSEGGEHSTAVQTWKTIIEQYGSTAKSWHGMSDALEAAGHFQKSDQCRLKAEELESSKSEHEAQTDEIKEVDLIAAAQIVIQKVQPTEDKGDDDVNTSIEWYNKGLSLLADNKGIEALQCFEKTVGSAPRQEKDLRVRAHNGRGNALHQLGQYVESIQSYHQAISMDPTMVTGRTMYNMGSSYAAMEHFLDAVSCFEQALERDLEEEENLLCRTQLNRCMLLLKEQQKLDRLRA